MSISESGLHLQRRKLGGEFLEGTITHKKITELTPKLFRFGKDQLTPEIHQLSNHRARLTEDNLKIAKFGSVIMLCVMVICSRGRKIGEKPI